MKFKNIFKNDTSMTTENTLNDEIVDKTPVENSEINSDILDSTIEERVEEITREEQLSQDLASEKDKFLRLFAEFENYKRRTTKERIELFKTANQEVLLAMLPVLDDFDRAMVEINKSDDELLTKGVALIVDKLKSTLVSKGLEEVEVRAGDTFDADFAEAITQIPAPSAKMKGKIVDVLEKGYKLGDKIIRFPKVVIGQ
ncbi:nucleotide exchange factor GrpE [Flavobacterium cellulosilyticum]|uniref:Protein GrpE n=2 Tax=Flavobacterium cellulosilyticum TaxID=2541731 RepID=A0A4V2YZI3_9FLAO|nr:nucleotide exchange factor GrpE [Flavobacterium cellulosilyticum]TDD97287.1 nucleotide exchange factor GrpE [Flavobacterium cellulosilyticum]